MNRFIRNCLFFGLLILLGLAGAELYAEHHSKSVFAEKSRGLEKQKDQIETLFVGTSITFWGIDPALWPNPAFNIGINSATLDLESQLFTSVVPKLTNLKLVVLELSYFTMYDDYYGEGEHWKKWIEPTIFFHTQKHSRLSRYGVLASDPDQLRRDIVTWKKDEAYHSEPNGHCIFDPKLHAKKNLTHEEKIKRSRMEGILCDLYDVNWQFLTEIVNICKDRNIPLIIYIPPVNLPSEDIDHLPSVKALYSTIRKVQSLYHIRVIDYFHDPRFNDADFVDVIHLSPTHGSQKLTTILAQEIYNQT